MNWIHLKAFQQSGWACFVILFGIPCTKLKGVDKFLIQFKTSQKHMETPCCGSLSGLWLYFGITVIRKENPLNERFWAVLPCNIVFSYSAKEVVLTCEFKTELSRTWSIKWHWAMQQKSSLVLFIKNWSPSKISPLVPIVVVSSFLSCVVYYAS